MSKMCLKPCNMKGDSHFKNKIINDIGGRDDKRVEKKDSDDVKLCFYDSTAGFSSYLCRS